MIDLSAVTFKHHHYSFEDFFDSVPTIIHTQLSAQRRFVFDEHPIHP
jgi:hypothetical protein